MQIPFYQQQMPMQSPMMTMEGKEEQKAEIFVQEEDKTGEEVRATSNSMIEVLSKSDNPKHRNSKFLKFLKKLAHGAYTIENEQIVKSADKLAEFKSMELERIKEESLR